MKRTTITLAALVVALLPAGAGLWGNASFSQAVPVKVPASAPVAPGTATVPTSSRTTEAGDDHGGDTPRDQRTEPGDDHGGSGGHGSDDAGGDDHGGDHGGGHGSDD